MGRPVKRDILGTVVFGTPAAGAVGIVVKAYFGGSLETAAYIVKQKGSRRYQVTANGTDTAVCKLVSGTPAADGEMQMVGFTQPYQADSNVIAIRHLRKRTAIDFSGNRYTWYLENDSSADVIVLTAI